MSIDGGTDREKPSSKLRPLIALAPYVARYRGRAVLALIALTVAAMTTLFGAGRGAADNQLRLHAAPGIALINSYFSVMIAVVGVLALAGAHRATTS